MLTLLADAAAGAADRAPLWFTNTPWWEFVLRGVIMYAFVLILLRVTGKRQVGQLAPFDLVLLLVLSNSVQNAMNGGDNSITGGIISACTLVFLNYIVGFLTFKSKIMEAIIEGKPIVLIHNGTLSHRAMNKARMTIHELNAALRAGGCNGPHEVRIAVLENGGNITVIKKNGENNHDQDHAGGQALPTPHEHQPGHPQS
ncbi:MAG TPA: YetF domain-containing protein [Phycisphaerae bacterium]|jgi:uncharacterized membrane protein YcaP (DUF421 family)|nr:YetF domain-containing protein [Phycisphaerae bacterium]